MQIGSLADDVSAEAKALIDERAAAMIASEFRLPARRSGRQRSHCRRRGARR